MDCGGFRPRATAAIETAAKGVRDESDSNAIDELARANANSANPAQRQLMPPRSKNAGRPPLQSEISDDRPGWPKHKRLDANDVAAAYRKLSSVGKTPRSAWSCLLT
jgi:hypothetical protein